MILDQKGCNLERIVTGYTPLAASSNILFPIFCSFILILVMSACSLPAILPQSPTSLPAITHVVSYITGASNCRAQAGQPATCELVLSLLQKPAQKASVGMVLVCITSTSTSTSTLISTSTSTSEGLIHLSHTVSSCQFTGTVLVCTVFTDDSSISEGQIYLSYMVSSCQFTKIAAKSIHRSASESGESDAVFTPTSGTVTLDRSASMTISVPKGCPSPATFILTDATTGTPILSVTPCGD